MPLAPTVGLSTVAAALPQSAADGSHWTLLVYVIVALGISFLCSVWEAVLLSTPLSHLQVMAESGRPSGRHMLAMRNRVEQPISAILTLNTIAHTIGAAGAGAEATLLFGSRWFGLISVVLTLLILIFSEIIPKTLGTTFCRQLAGFTGVSLVVLVRVLAPVVAALELIARQLRPRRREPAVTRGELQAMARLGAQEGSLADDERLVFENVLRLDRMKVSEVMTPRTIMTALPAALTVGEVRSAHEGLRFSRIPIYGRDQDDMEGYVLRTDLLEHAAAGSTDTTLRSLVRPLHALPEIASVAKALDRFISGKEHLFLVVDEYGGTAGLLALEDVLETLLGREIVDESDSTVDLQELARRRYLEHQKRLAEIAEARERGEED